MTSRSDFVDQVRTGLEAANPDMPVFTMPERGRIAAYCPVRCGGTLAITFVETVDGPEAIVSSGRQVGDILGCCSRGCTAKQILGALA